jgi:dienelactone hydrolase
MLLRCSVRHIGLSLVWAAAFAVVGPGPLPLTQSAAAQEAEDCDVCALRHQRLTRGKNAHGSDEGRPYPEMIEFVHEADGRSHSLAGRLYRPGTSEPAPAILILHGCAGAMPLRHVWAERFQSWGYVALVLDPFWARIADPLCEKADTDAPHGGSIQRRILEARGAHGFLSGLDFVDPQRIALVGWSQGAEVAQLIASGNTGDTGSIPARRPSFRSVVAFATRCVALERIKVPLLILMAGPDNRAHQARCRRLMASPKSLGDSVKIESIPNAAHSADGTKSDRASSEDEGISPNDAQAVRNAIEKVRDFLAGHLGD